MGEWKKMQCNMSAVSCGLPSAQGEGVVAATLKNAIGTQYFYNPVGIEFMGFWWSCGKIFGRQISVPETARA